MTYRIAFAALLFMAGAYTSISFLVDSWEGGRCWVLGDANYIRLPFVRAFPGAGDALLTRAQTRPFSTTAELLGLGAFLWPVVAVLIANRLIISILALLLILVPFALTVHGQIVFGIDEFCVGDGMAALGFGALQLFVVLPIGFFAFCTAIFARGAEA